MKTHPLMPAGLKILVRRHWSGRVAALVLTTAIASLFTIAQPGYLVPVAFSVPVAWADARSDLAAVEAKVAAEFPALNHMQPDALAVMISSGQPVLIFDVREESEYAVSHLAGATRVAPNSDPAAFAASIAASAKGKAVVFYCSVGMRSSRLASKAAPHLMQGGAASVNNLRGGIFRWSNEGRPLEKGAATPGKASNSGVTVHPYNASWGKLIEEPKAAAH